MSLVSDMTDDEVVEEFVRIYFSDSVEYNLRVALTKIKKELEEDESVPFDKKMNLFIRLESTLRNLIQSLCSDLKQICLETFSAEELRAILSFRQDFPSIEEKSLRIGPKVGELVYTASSAFSESYERLIEEEMKAPPTSVKPS
jgi:hypothetical protein